MKFSHIYKRGDRDRLSELPDSLILLILSSLKMAKAVETTFLSRRWRNLWTKIPCLHFWYDACDSDECRSFINGALFRWKGPNILKFSITFSDKLPPANDLDLWLHLAVDKQVEELSINLQHHKRMCRRGGLVSSDYCPPQCLYSSSSITKLSLSFFKLKIGGNVRWDRLKSLTILGRNSLSEEAMNKVLCGAPQLEELVLFISEIDENLTIKSSSLKTLRISREDRDYEDFKVCYNSVLTISAPNLLNLAISSLCDGSVVLDVPSLTNAVIEFYGFGSGFASLEFPGGEMYSQVFQSVCHVESLTLSNGCVKLLLYLKMKDVLLQFSNAKSLHLGLGEPADEMLDVLEMFPKLVNLNAEFCHSFKDVFSFSSATTASLNHLKTIEITWSLRRHSIFRVIHVLLGKAHVLEKMVLRFVGFDSDWIFNVARERVLKMLGSSPTVKVIIMKG